MRYTCDALSKLFEYYELNKSLLLNHFVFSTKPDNKQVQHAPHGVRLAIQAFERYSQISFLAGRPHLQNLHRKWRQTSNSIKVFRDSAISVKGSEIYSRDFLYSINHVGQVVIFAFLDYFKLLHLSSLNISLLYLQQR